MSVPNATSSIKAPPPPMMCSIPWPTSDIVNVLSMFTTSEEEVVKPSVRKSKAQEAK